MAKEGTRFDIPADMLALAEKSVEQAKQAFDIFISAAQHAVSTAETQAATAQAGAKQVGELAMGFAERNIASSFEFAQKLLQAKEPKDDDGDACGVRKYPNCGADRSSQGTGQTRGENDRPRYPTLNLPASSPSAL